MKKLTFEHVKNFDKDGFNTNTKIILTINHITNIILPFTKFMSVKNICLRLMNMMTAIYMPRHTYNEYNNVKVSILALTANFFIIFLVSTLFLTDNQSSIAALMFILSLFWLTIKHRFFIIPVEVDAKNIILSIFELASLLLQRSSVVRQGSTIN